MGILNQNAGMVFQIDGDSKKLKGEFKDIDAALDRLAKKSSSGGGFSSVFGGNLASQGASKFLDMISQGGRAIFDFSSKMEQSKVGFTSLMKNSDQASAHIKELLALSRSTPLQFESISSMSSRLQGAGIEAQKVIPLIKDIGNVAAATGELSAERMEGIGVAFAQIASKGKVSAEEMEQLAERGVPAWRILSESIGKTAAETRKMAEDGKISSDQLFAAFQKFSQMNFGDAMEKQAATFSGSMGQIANIALQTANTAFQPIYDEISKFSAKIAKSLRDQESEAKAEGVSFGFAFGEAIGDGIERSRVTDSSWWKYVLTPIAIAEWAENLGKDIGGGIVKGFEDASDPLGKEVAGLERETKRFNAAWAKLLSERARLNSILHPTAPGISDADKKKAEADAEKAKRLAEELARRDASASLSGQQNNLQNSRNDIDESVDQMIAKLAELGSSDNAVAGLAKDFDRLANNLNITLAALEAIENQKRATNTANENALLTQNQRLRRDQEEANLAEAREKFKKGVAEFDKERAEKADQQIQNEIDKTRELMELEEERRKQQENDLPSPGLASPGGLPAADPSNAFKDTLAWLTDPGQGGAAMQMMDRFAQGIGNIVQNLVLMGTAGPNAMRKMTASVLASVAAQAAVQAVMFAAYGIAALTPWGAAIYGPALPWFKAAALMGSIALGTGLAGRAIAGNSFSEGGAGSGAGSGIGGDEGNGNRPGLRFTETFQGFEKTIDEKIGRVMEKTNAVLGRVGEQIDKFAEKFGGVSPGQVVMAGAEHASDAIHAAHTSAMQADGGKATETKRALGEYS